MSAITSRTAHVAVVLRAGGERAEHIILADSRQALLDAAAEVLLAEARATEPEAAERIEAAPQFSEQTIDILERVLDVSVQIAERPVLPA